MKSAFDRVGCQVVAISRDSQHSHKIWQETELSKMVPGGFLGRWCPMPTALHRPQLASTIRRLASTSAGASSSIPTTSSGNGSARHRSGATSARRATDTRLSARPRHGRGHALGLASKLPPSNPYQPRGAVWGQWKSNLASNASVQGSSGPRAFFVQEVPALRRQAAGPQAAPPPSRRRAFPHPRPSPVVTILGTMDSQRRPSWLMRASAAGGPALPGS